MMSIDFYGEIAKVIKPKTFQELKAVIAKEYSIQQEELNGLILVFENQKKSKEILNDNTFNSMINKTNPVVSVSVSENSKLFQCVQNELKPEIKNINHLQEEQNSNDLNIHNLKNKLSGLEKTFSNEQKKYDELANKNKQQDNKPYQLIEKVIEQIVDNKFNEAKKSIIEGALMETSKYSSLMINTNNSQESKSLLFVTNRSICNSEHQGIKCKGCGVYPIKGLRFMCTICNSFNYCEKCEESKGIDHQHPFLKVRFPLV